MGNKNTNLGSINTEGGNVQIGDQTINTFKESRLSGLFKKLSNEYAESQITNEICDELENYLTDRDPVSLRDKLLITEFGDDFIEDAEFLRQTFSKKLYKYNEYESAQRIFTFILSLVFSKFKRKILPLIKSGKSLEEINENIHEYIIDPLYEVIESEGLHDDVLCIDVIELEGMLYFLTGRCHLKWN